MMTTEEWNDKPTGSSDKRADLPSPLGAVAMRDAVYKAARRAYNKTENFPAIFDAIEKTPMPTHAAMLAHAMRLPEVAALRKALHFYADFYENPNEGPWGVNSEDFGKVARKALEAKP